MDIAHFSTLSLSLYLSLHLTHSPGCFTCFQIQLQPNCEKLQPLLRQSHNDYNLAVLVGIIFSCFGIVLIVMAFFLWR